METNQKVILGILIVAVIIAGVALYYRYEIRGHGRIGTIEVDVYGEAELINKVTEIDWGTIFAGQYREANLWIVNTGNVEGNLSLTTENWSPLEAENYLGLTWNYIEGQELQPDEVIPVILTLTVSGDITGITDFSMDIIIAVTYDET